MVTVPEDVRLQYTHPQTSDPMISQSDFQYALYRKCSSDSNFTLVENGIQDTFYNMLHLPAKTSCTVRLVAYSNDCPFVFGGRFSVDRTFTTAASSEFLHCVVHMMHDDYLYIGLFVYLCCVYAKA